MSGLRIPLVKFSSVDQKLPWYISHIFLYLEKKVDITKITLIYLSQVISQKDKFHNIAVIKHVPLKHATKKKFLFQLVPVLYFLLQEERDLPSRSFEPTTSRWSRVELWWLFYSQSLMLQDKVLTSSPFEADTCLWAKPFMWAWMPLTIVTLENLFRALVWLITPSGMTIGFREASLMIDESIPAFLCPTHISAKGEVSS